MNTPYRIEKENLPVKHSEDDDFETERTQPFQEPDEKEENEEIF